MDLVFRRLGKVAFRDVAHLCPRLGGGGSLLEAERRKPPHLRTYNHPVERFALTKVEQEPEPDRTEPSVRCVELRSRDVARRPAPSGGPVGKSLMICCSYKGCVSRFGLVDFWELLKHNHDSGSFAESSHPSWSRRAVILLFATFRPARLLKDRSGQNLLQFHGSFLSVGRQSRSTVTLATGYYESNSRCIMAAASRC